jgi:hypothetical protein
MTAYDRTEFGWPVVIVLAISAAFVAALDWRLGITWAAVIVPSLLVVLAVMFSALRVRVGDGALHWSFLLGFPSGTIPLATLTDVEATTTTLLDGIGLHLTFRGWVWNVHNGSAVWLHRSDGGPVIIGTSDANGLIAAIERARS